MGYTKEDFNHVFLMKDLRFQFVGTEKIFIKHYPICLNSINRPLTIYSIIVI